MEAVLTSSQEKEVNNNERVKEGETAACDLAVSPRTVTVTDPEEWICVAKLPPDTDHQAFLHLLSDFGSVKDSFLQKSTKTGESFSRSIVFVGRPCQLDSAIFNSQFLQPPPLLLNSLSARGGENSESTHVGNLDIARTIRAPGNRQIDSN